MPEYSTVVIVGSGLMGSGIAVVHALAGCTVTLVDLHQKALDAASEKVLGALRTLVAAEELTDEEAASAYGRVSFSIDLNEAIPKADLVVEAIVEDPNAKAQLFARLAQLMSGTSVLASNTSYLDIFPLLPSTLAARTLIVHWYTPPYIIDLVDVVAGPTVPAAQVSQMVSFLESMGKSPMQMKKFVPGYVSNRVQMAIESEIFRLLDEGVAVVEDIDKAIMDGLALRLALYGQFKKIDYTGLRVVRDSHQRGVYVPPTPPTTCKRLNELVEQGKLGVNSGEGFYDYSDGTSDELFAARDKELIATKRAIKAIKANRP